MPTSFTSNAFFQQPWSCLSLDSRALKGQNFETDPYSQIKSIYTQNHLDYPSARYSLCHSIDPFTGQKNCFPLEGQRPNKRYTMEQLSHSESFYRFQSVLKQVTQKKFEIVNPGYKFLPCRTTTAYQKQSAVFICWTLNLSYLEATTAS